jgi:hypothetical protein
MKHLTALFDGIRNYDGTVMAVTYPVPYRLRPFFLATNATFFEMGGVKSYVVWLNGLKYTNLLPFKYTVIIISTIIISFDSPKIVVPILSIPCFI